MNKKRWLIEFMLENKLILFTNEHNIKTCSNLGRTRDITEITCVTDLDHFHNQICVFHSGARKQNDVIRFTGSDHFIHCSVILYD